MKITVFARSSIILLLAPAMLLAAEPETEHLYRLVDGEQHPEATLEDANWLIGSWTGTAFDKRFEEVFEQPLVYERTRSP